MKVSNLSAYLDGRPLESNEWAMVEVGKAPFVKYEPMLLRAALVDGMKVEIFEPADEDFSRCYSWHRQEGKWTEVMPLHSKGDIAFSIVAMELSISKIRRRLYDLVFRDEQLKDGVAAANKAADELLARIDELRNHRRESDGVEDTARHGEDRAGDCENRDGEGALSGFSPVLQRGVDTEVDGPRR